jgi:hypothetical protein
VGVPKYAIYAWKVKYGGIDVSQAQEAKQYRDEKPTLLKLGRSEPGQGRAAVGGPKKRLELVALETAAKVGNKIRRAILLGRGACAYWFVLGVCSRIATQRITEHLASADDLLLARSIHNDVASPMRNGFSAALLGQQPVHNYLCLSAHKYLSVSYKRNAELRGDSESIA